MTSEDVQTGTVISYNFLWVREHGRGVEHGRKARPACVVVPLTSAGNTVVLFPLTTQEPGSERVAFRVPETERRRVKLRGSAPCWIILDEGNSDTFPGSFHVEPISHDPMTVTYGRFSQAFVAQILQVLATAIRARRTKVVNRQD